jgi:hypothetical protein
VSGLAIISLQSSPSLVQISSKFKRSTGSGLKKRLTVERAIPHSPAKAFLFKLFLIKASCAFLMPSGDAFNPLIAIA